MLAYSCNPQCLPFQHPQSLPILTHLEASKHPSIQVSLTAGIPYSIILKGTQLGATGVHRPFLDADLEPPNTPLGPQIGTLACTGVPNGSFDRHPGIQASRHPCLRSQRSAAEAVAYKSGRGLEGRAHQAACRRPRGGAEAENRGTSHKCFVLEIK